jgi:4-hydroxyacetophenone monooxygenase
MRTLEAGKRKIEVKSDINTAYNQRVDDEHERMVWTHTGVTNWYKNSQGRVVSNSPWRLVDYWHMTHSPDMSDYKLS